MDLCGAWRLEELRVEYDGRTCRASIHTETAQEVVLDERPLARARPRRGLCAAPTPTWWPEGRLAPATHSPVRWPSWRIWKTAFRQGCGIYKAGSMYKSSGAAGQLWLQLVVCKFGLACFTLDGLLQAFEIWVKALLGCCSGPTSMAQMASYSSLEASL